MSRLAAASRVHVRAPGKINVFFEVGERQEDGYHDVASVYQAVSAYEDVWAEDAAEFTVTVSGPGDVSGVPLDDRNLAVRAARMLARRSGYDRGVHLDIVKSVPVAGGMGGGSADAAAALVACDALWGTAQSPQQLHALAARLGADVPFALMGGTAVGTGRGDQLSPALAAGRLDWVLVTSDEGMSTPEVYTALDRRREAEALDIRPSRAPNADPAVLQALRAGDAQRLAPHLRNDLQDAAFDLRPDLVETLALGERHGALVGMVSGSGPTIAFLAGGETEALDLQVSLSAAGRVARHVHGPVGGARILSR